MTAFKAVPIGAAFEVRNGATPASGEERFWDGEIPWVTPADLGALTGRTLSCGRRSITLDGYASCGTQMVPAGSLILSTRAPVGHLAIAGTGICFNQGCRGLVPRRIIRSDFGYWALLAQKPTLEAAAQGTTFVELSTAKLRAERIPIPDLPIQKAIADFLDRETARIDQLIEKKERLVLILEEKKRIAAIQCLSHGMSGLYWDNNTSAIRFLFEQPHWVERTVKSLVRFMTSGSRGWSDLLGAEGEGFIQSGNIGRRMDVDLNFAQRVQPQTGAEADRTLVKSGDVLVCITGGRTGAVGFVREIGERAYINQHVCLLRADHRVILPELLAHLLWSEIGQKQIELCQYGVKQGLGFNEVANIRIPVPPRDQQSCILEDITRTTRSIDLVVERIQQSGARLRELRAALITAAVTGQIDVATWGKRGETDRRLEAIEQEMGAAREEVAV
ncbi:MAG: restriction endonuclease subunit S [Thermomicrobiales bacterium]